MKALLIQLSKTFIISIILSLVANALYYSIFTKSADYGHVIPLLIMGSLFLNIIILIMTLPVLFLSYPHIWGNVISRSLLYFSGPVVFIITILTTGLQHGDFEVYLITGVIFLVIHTGFYFKMIKRRARFVQI
jgi:hypothetical protein